MRDYSLDAINAASDADIAYCKFITPNDTGGTGSHQSGYHVHKEAYKILFPTPGQRGELRERNVKIKWQNDFETDSRFIYYGQRTRNEYRITRFGRGFPFLSEDTAGSLLVLCKVEENYYKAFVLETDEEIDNFLDFFSISPLEANSIISARVQPPDNTEALIEEYAQGLPEGFPTTTDLSSKAQQIFDHISGLNNRSAVEKPDYVISGWIDTEYRLFKAVEKIKYDEYLHSNFESVDGLIEIANTILNRRKSRAGKSLENHLARIFDLNDLSYSAQKTTEGHKRPDFIMPSIEAYRDERYPNERLVFLAAKTTCKDRWRQIINEAGRIEIKYLFTLQQGISTNQLKEMNEENVRLVVPETSLTSFSLADRPTLLTLKNFISYSKSLVQ